MPDKGRECEVDFIQKLFITITLFIVLMGTKKIAENFLNNKWLVFIVSLFGLFNPFIYDRIMYGQIGVVLAFGLMCLCFGYMLKYLTTRKNKNLVYAGIFVGLSLIFSKHFLF